MVSESVHSWEQGEARTSREHGGAATKAEDVYNRIRSLIVAGHFAPGARLDQTDLAGQLRVSRMPLRQALTRLQADGLIEGKARSSLRVTLLSRRAAKELYAIRTALEPDVAAVAAAIIPDDLVGRLHAVNDEMAVVANFGDFPQFVTIDRRFHRILYEQSRYYRAVRYIEQVRDASDRYVLAYARYRRGASESVQEHEDVLKAITRRDIEGVRTLVREHVTRGAKVLLEVID